MNNYKAFTLKNSKGRLKVLKTSCGISEAYDPKLKKSVKPKINKFEAIWDTGATSTVITAKVANDLRLKPIGFATSHHAGGVSRVPTYLINVYLPQNVDIIGVKAIQAVLSGNTEILIGMDIISHGDFAFTNVGGKSCFSFRIPSLEQIDYVKEANSVKNPIKKPMKIGRNQPCSCGSGKKYKHCCGKNS